MPKCKTPCCTNTISHRFFHTISSSNKSLFKVTSYKQQSCDKIYRVYATIGLHRSPFNGYAFHYHVLLYSCLGTGVRASGEFAHTYCTCQNCKIIGKVKMESTGMWGLTLVILKDIKCFQIWAYFEGIGINFNFENFRTKIFPLFILRTIQSMHARYHRTLQHLSKIEGWFVYTSFSLKC